MDSEPREHPIWVSWAMLMALLVFLMPLHLAWRVVRACFRHIVARPARMPMAAARKAPDAG